MVILMKFRYNLNEQSYIVVDDSTGCFIGTQYKNGCSHNLLQKRTETLAEMEQWIEKLKEVLNGKL